MVTVRVLPQGRDAVLEVEDNGPGIPAPARAGAVRRFRRGEAAAPGMGLGLPVAQEIAGLFGGTLTLAEGAGGRGLRARISLPVISKAATAQESDAIDMKPLQS
nr:sensor histidine kinase [Paracoccus thiocyanatus]